jgi:tetratricopeptide (TPR) repeat protein
MQPTDLLNSLGLAEYIQAFEDNAIDGGSLISLSDADLKELGVAKLGHRKKILEAIVSLSSAPAPDAADAIVDMAAQLPNIVALPLREYASEEHPVAKLWAMCDTTELLLRLVVVVFVSKQREHGGLSEKTAESLSSLVESPTLGAWFVMAQTLAKDADDSLRAAAEFVEGPLRDLLYGPDKPGTAETSLLRMRNRLAHGGGLTRREAARLLQLWQPKFDGTVSQMSWLSGWELVGCDKEGRWLSLAGAEPAASSFAPEERSHEVDAVWIKIGPHSFPLWPLAVYGAARAPGASKVGAEDLTQIYTRRDSVRLAYTPLGAEGIAQSESGPSGFEAFKTLFHLDRPRSSDFSVADFAAEIRKDAAQAVGRDGEVAEIVAAVHESDQGVLWISGAAGTGKSFLVAKAHAELLDRKPGDNTAVLAYRFRASDQARCSREALATFLEERLAAAGACVAVESKDAGTDAAKHISDCLGRVKAGWRIVIFLDGLDEIARHDEKFAGEIPLDIRPANVLWVCSGRSESGLAKAMDSLGAVNLFPQGLPPMSNDDIRAMVLEKIGPLRKKLLVGDKEKGDSVVNPFIDLVTMRAAGLPLYVKYVIGDVLSGKYRVLDGQEDLPDSLHAYHEDLLRRLAVGDLQAVVTPLVATLACAHEPLSVREIESVLVYRKLLTPDGATALVEEGLAATASMLSSAPDPEGETGFTLFHQSLRDHMRTSEQMRQSMTTGIAAMADLSVLSVPPEELRNYLLRCGIRHLLDTGRRNEAQALLLNPEHMALMQAQGVEAEAAFALWRELGDSDRSGAYVEVLRNYLAVPSEAKLPAARFIEKLCRISGWMSDGANVAELSLRAHEQTLGGSHPETIKSGVAHAGWLRLGGLYLQARERLERLLEICAQALGVDHHETIRCINGLALAHRALSNTQEAEKLHRQAFALSGKSLGVSHPDTLVAASNLALCLAEIGKAEEAETVLRQCLCQRENAFGVGHRSVLEHKMHLGALLSSTGRRNEGEQLLRDSFVGLQTTLGFKHPSTLNAAVDLANQLNTVGKNDEAYDLLEKVLDARREMFGSKHPAFWGTRNDLALVLLDKRELHSARQMYDEVIAAVEESYGPDHSMVAGPINNLALILMEEKRFEEAKTLLQRCLAIHERTHGACHPGTLKALNNLGTLATEQQDLENAEYYFRKCLVGREKGFGWLHEATLEAASNLGLILSRKGEHESAADLFCKAMHGFEQLGGADEMRTLDCTARFGAALLALERRNEAIDLFQKVYEGRRRTLGDHHEKTLGDLALFAALLDRRTRTRDHKKSEGGRAIELYNQLFAAARNAPDIMSRITLKAIARLGFLRKQVGDFAEAQEAYIYALQKFEQNMGPLHEDTLQTAINLALVYKEQGDFEREKAVYKKFLPPEQGVASELPPGQSKFLGAMRNRLLELEMLDIEFES